MSVDVLHVAALPLLLHSVSVLGFRYIYYTAISNNVVGSKYKAVRQDLKILWIFFMNKITKISYASPVQ